MYSALFGMRRDTESLMAFVVFLVATIVFALIWVGLFQFRKSLFVKYTRRALALGVTGMTVIALLSMMSFASRSWSGDAAVAVDSCSSLEEQLRIAQSATVPIGTNLGEGTAFAVDNKGTLLTVNHVIEGAKEIYLNYASGKVPVKVIKREPRFDIALLKTNEPTDTFLCLTGGYTVGDGVYALGYPRNGLSAGQASLSGGLLSRVLTNSDLKLNDKKAPKGLEIVQTDTALNPGNSGGPLMNECGVIGVVSAKSDALQFGEYGLSSEEGISFAISSRTISERFKLKMHNL